MIDQAENPSAIIEILLELPLFDALRGEELEVVSRHLNYFEFEAGDVIFEEGDRGDYVCFVVEGIVEVVKKSTLGRDAVIATLSKGRSIGEMSIIDKARRSATAVAKTPARLVTMTDRGFHGILENHPSVGIKMLIGMARLLSMNLRKTSSRLADYMLPIS